MCLVVQPLPQPQTERGQRGLRVAAPPCVGVRARMAPKKKKGGEKKEGSQGEARPQSAPASKGKEPSDETDDTETGEDVEDEQQNVGKASIDGSDISKVTDFVEQRELDAKKASEAVAALAALDEVDREAEAKRERELAAVKINQEDVDLIASEMELDKDLAERKLREHNGDAVQTLVTLVSE